ncbi:MAG: nucleotidyltransferase domain-containing protein [Candidatus Kapaibacterium sp.]|jgi:predicted nucleotidyltransferase
MIDKDLNIAKEIVLKFIDKDITTVFLFGSRVDNTFRKNSDIDIGFISENCIDLLTFNDIRDALENSGIPYHFDLVDFNNAKTEFKENAMKNIVLWNKSKNLN